MIVSNDRSTSLGLFYAEILVIVFFLRSYDFKYFHLQQLIYSQLLSLGNYFYLMILFSLQTLLWFPKSQNNAQPVTRAIVCTDYKSAAPTHYFLSIYICVYLCMYVRCYVPKYMHIHIEHKPWFPCVSVKIV